MAGGAVAAITVLGLLVAAGPALAQDREPRPPRPAPGDTVLAAPAGRYPAGTVRRFLLGAGHRDLWSLPVPAQVLDLDRFAGGLTLEGPGGGNQTRSLRFLDAGGRSWTFRSVDKDAARALAPELRRSVAASILQDQISSLFPLSALVVTPLVEAVGVLHPGPRLRVMPYDPRLGEHREEFAGMLGWIEERPDEVEDGRPGFAGSRRVVGSERLLELLEEDPAHRVDARAFLRARLVDVLVGDWDRHPDQWRWARFPARAAALPPQVRPWGLADDGTAGAAGEVFLPVPRDRDWALARIDGAFTRLSWIPWPQYLGFGGDLGSPFRRTWNGQALDRRLLVGLSRENWREVTRSVVAALDDGVVAAAVARLPQAYHERVGEGLEAELRARRDALPAFSDAWYELLAGWVDIHTTDRPEVARLTRHGSDTVVVEVVQAPGEGRAGKAPRPHVRRTFVASETREIRLHLHGGDDRIRVDGSPAGRIVLRLLGGGSDDTYEDRTSGHGVHVHDDRGDNVLRLAPGTSVDDEPWEEPYDPEERTDRVPARDWGSRVLPLAELSYSPDWGLGAGLGAQRISYGFRRWPHRARVSLEGGMIFRTGRLQGSARLDAALGRATRLQLAVEARGAEIRRFYGFGNDTEAPGGDDPFRAERREIRLEARVAHRFSPEAEAGVALALRDLRDLGNPGTLVDRVAPYGFPDFRQVGLQADLALEGTAPTTLLQESRRLRVRAAWVPATLDVRRAFATVEAEASASLPLGREDALAPPVLAVRTGGRKVWGDVPYHEAAILGGRNDLRGYRNQRYSGHAALFANAELRVGLGRFFLLLPGDVGVFALGDAGRVFHEADRSGGWHVAAGGGVWVSFLQAWSATLAVARGSITGVYLTVGFPF